MAASYNIPALEQRPVRILRQVANIGNVRPGALVHCYMKCGNPSCSCRQSGERGHSPYFVPVRQARGKRISRTVPPAADAAIQA